MGIYLSLQFLKNIIIITIIAIIAITITYWHSIFVIAI